MSNENERAKIQRASNKFDSQPDYISYMLQNDEENKYHIRQKKSHLQDMNNNTTHSSELNQESKFELISVHDSEYVSTNSRQVLMYRNMSGSIRSAPSIGSFAKNVLIKSHDSNLIDSADQEGILSNKAIRNIAEGMADINAGRTYTSEEVKKILRLHETNVES